MVRRAINCCIIKYSALLHQKQENYHSFMLNFYQNFINLDNEGTAYSSVGVISTLKKLNQYQTQGFALVKTAQPNALELLRQKNEVVA